ncbi:hypothetical protein KKF61_05740 [Patescibacteria group bacterium]|nr:hypothetical protein [Patescibacteria group bacterium]
MNGRIVQTYIRIPKQGSLLANVAQGGKMLEIKKSAVPKKAIKIAFLIDKKIKRMGNRMYAMDFGFENGRPYVFELNPRAGFPYPQWKMYYHIWHKELLKTLMQCIK